jgi:capsular polysaccharide biosynthesis protein
VQEPVRGTSPTWAWLLVALAAAVAAANVVVAIARRRSKTDGGTTARLGSVGRPWITLSALTFVLVGGACLLLVPQQENTYESTALIGFQPRDPSVTSADTLALVTPKFLALLDSSTTLRELGDQLGVDEGRLRSSINAVIEPGTATLRISVTRTDPKAAAMAANALAAAVLQDAGRDDLVLAQRISAGVPSEAPTPPTPSQLLAVGLLTALIAALAVAFFVRRWTGAQRLL